MQRPLWQIVFLLFLTGFIGKSSFAQNNSNYLLQYTGYIAIEDTTTVEYLINNDSLFKTPTNFPTQSNQKDAYWLKLDFTEYLNLLKKDSIYILKTIKLFEANYFYLEQDRILTKDFGFFHSLYKSDTKFKKNDIIFKKENLIKGHLLYLKIKRFTPNHELNNLKLTFHSQKSYIFNHTYYSKKQMMKLAPVYLFLGASGFIILFAFITFYSTRKLDFLFYSFYVICLVLYLGKSAFGIEEYINNHYTKLAFWAHSVLQILINLFYVIFAKHYLETKKNYPKLEISIRIIKWVLIGLVIIETTSIFMLKYETHHLIMNLHRVLMSIFAVASFVYLFIYAKNTLAYFIIIGSLAFTAGSLAMLFTFDKNYMILGAVIEAFLFGMGLSYKMKLNSREKRRLKQMAFEDRISALRAQMNPHFIFNSLSSIQHLITSDKKESAIKYLNKFSLLMRNLLESSIEAKVVLSEEISLLKKYLELEALRFNNSFEFDISVTENLDAEAIEIPALLVQPFVENAILHGLLNKPGNDKLLEVRFRKENTFIICEIEDNGIGRKASAEKKSPLKASKKSRGIELTEKRLELLNHSQNNSIEFIDKTNNEGKAEGTLVILKISIE